MSSGDRSNNWKQVLKTQQSDLERLQVLLLLLYLWILLWLLLLLLLFKYSTLYNVISLIFNYKAMDAALSDNIDTEKIINYNPSTSEHKSSRRT